MDRERGATIEGPGLSEDGYRYRAPLSKTLSVQLDTLNLVQRFGGQVTFSAVWATDDRDILNNEQIFSLAITAGYVTDASAFLTTNVTNHCSSFAPHTP